MPKIGDRQREERAALVAFINTFKQHPSFYELYEAHKAAIARVVVDAAKEESNPTVKPLPAPKVVLPRDMPGALSDDQLEHLRALLRANGFTLYPILKEDGNDIAISVGWRGERMVNILYDRALVHHNFFKGCELTNMKGKHFRVPVRSHKQVWRDQMVEHIKKMVMAYQASQLGIG